MTILLWRILRSIACTILRYFILLLFKPLLYLLIIGSVLGICIAGAICAIHRSNIIEHPVIDKAHGLIVENLQNMKTLVSDIAPTRHSKSRVYGTSKRHLDTGAATPFGYPQCLNGQSLDIHTYDGMIVGADPLRGAPVWVAYKLMQDAQSPMKWLRGARAYEDAPQADKDRPRAINIIPPEELPFCGSMAAYEAGPPECETTMTWPASRAWEHMSLVTLQTMAKHKELWVVAGAAYSPNDPYAQEMPVCHYKTLLYKDSGGNWNYAVYIIPQQSTEQPLSEYEVSRSVMERLIGIRFHPQLVDAAMLRTE